MVNSVMIDKMLDTLKVAQEQRNNLTNLVYDSVEDRHVPEWLLFERCVLFNLVNEERQKRGLNSISITDFHKAETLADGHSDYSRKIALYSAWLAEGQEHFVTA